MGAAARGASSGRDGATVRGGDGRGASTIRGAGAGSGLVVTGGTGARVGDGGDTGASRGGRRPQAVRRTVRAYLIFSRRLGAAAGDASGHESLCAGTGACASVPAIDYSGACAHNARAKQRTACGGRALHAGARVTAVADTSASAASHDEARTGASATNRGSAAPVASGTVAPSRPLEAPRAAAPTPLPAPVVPASSPPPAPNQFALALYNQRIGNNGEALSHYNALLAQNDSAEVHNNIGLIDIELGVSTRRSVSIGAPSRWMRSTSGAQQPRRGADAAEPRGRCRGGISLALSLDERNVESIVNLALVQKTAGRPAEARDLLRRAVAIDPGSAGRTTTCRHRRRERRSGVGSRALPRVPQVRLRRARRARRGGARAPRRARCVA